MVTITPLAQDYYLSNFEILVDHVFEFYQDLLNDTELNFYHAFHKLSHSGRCLFVRMIMRKGSLFRRDKLTYQEIPNIHQAVAELIRHGFATVPKELPLEALLPLYNIREWRAWLECPQRLLPTSLARPALNEAVQQSLPSPCAPPTTIIELQQQSCFTLFKLLYFGNPHQDLSQFVVTDLGHIRYPSYPLNKVSRQFQHRAEVDERLAYYAACEQLTELKTLDHAQLASYYAQIAEIDVNNATLHRKKEHTLLTIARQIERLNPENALAFYRQLNTGAAVERLVRILQKQNQFDEALALCQTMLQQNVREESRLFFHANAQRLCKKLQRPIPINHNAIDQTWVIKVDKLDAAVELLAIDKLSHLGDCFYVENSLFTCLFCLVYWPVIYADIQGAFTQPYQHRPHDLYESDFLTKRSAAYEAAANEFLTGANQQTYLDRFTQIQQLKCCFGPWPDLTTAIVQRALACIPKSDLQQIFKRMWNDLRFCRSGFPDLVCFLKNGGYQLIEVKGPGDNLQRNQQLWFAFFQEHNIPARVLRIAASVLSQIESTYRRGAT